MKLQGFKVFDGQHCESTAIGSLLQYEGLILSEPMLFGIGSGLGFIYLKVKTMPVPFLGGRSNELAIDLSTHLKIELEIKETASLHKAWENVKKSIESGHPVGLQLDCYYLEYFKSKMHFARHHVAMYGFDDKNAFLNDTTPQGGLVQTSLDSLRLARNEKGPMSAKNKSYTILSIPKNIDIKSAIIQGIKKNAEEYLNPPTSNLGYKGILKASKEIKKWLRNNDNPPTAFLLTAKMMERGGTGGALFRTMYCNFLGEAYNELKIDVLNKSKIVFSEIADKWSNVSKKFVKYSDTQNESYINEASDILAWLSHAEKAAFETLINELS